MSWFKTTFKRLRQIIEKMRERSKSPRLRHVHPHVPIPGHHEHPVNQVKERAAVIRT